MREIKFRCYEKEKGMWGMGSNSAMNLAMFWAIIADIKGKPNVMQFTGLLDKNGKEIYEGDIVRWTYTNSGKEMISEIKWKGVGFKPTRLSDRNIFEMKIIGNIYEHPHLLTNKE